MQSVSRVHEPLSALLFWEKDDEDDDKDEPPEKEGEGELEEPEGDGGHDDGREE